MDLFEYEGKLLLKSFGIPVPQSALITEKDSAAPRDYPFVLKAQVLTGGRGKAGGVKVCRTEEEYRQYADQILSMSIKGHQVHGLLAEELMTAEKELYISITQQGVTRPTLIVSACGGMDIEQVAATEPDRIRKFEIDPFTRLKGYQKNQIAEIMGVDRAEAIGFLEKLQKTFFDSHALLVEINPLGVKEGKLIALDSKVIIDDHARQAKAFCEEKTAARENLYAYREPEKEKTTVTYIQLDGDVGMISDGAGTGMLTLDMLRDKGLNVACFTELGGMTSEEVMYRALELTVENNPQLKAIIIVLIGGFNLMDNMARGITSYVREHGVTIPIFTRMCGTREEEGLRIMKEAGFSTYYDLTETVSRVCEIVKENA